METYNHFDYCEQMAMQLKAIGHTRHKPRYFKANGLEDLYNFDDKLSSVRGTILIAIDGYESSSTNNGADALTDTLQYSIILAQNTNSNRPESIDSAFVHCRQLAKQVRNRLLNDPELAEIIDRNTQINGIGPIGDNYYGVILSFSCSEAEEYFVDESYWS